MYAQHYKPDVALLKHFDDLLNSSSGDEAAFQSFLEEHPEFICTPYLQNHSLHWNAVISQYRLNTALTTDFAYLTKSSNVWWLVLVEIEPPSVPLFTKAAAVQPTALFSQRLAQVDTWERAFRSNPEEILRPLAPLLRPLAGNKVELRTVLICGRDSMRLQDPAARDWLAQQETRHRKILTWDSVRRFYASGLNRPKNILSIRKDRLCFNNLVVEPPSIFSYVTSHELTLTPSDKAKLAAWDYQIDTWEQGHALRYNEKYSTLEQRMKMMPL